MKWIELQRTPLTGQLNEHRLGMNDSGQLLLARIPKENTEILRSIAHEYHAIGFTDYGGRFRKRSPSEQVGFASSASLKGLRVLPPVFTEGEISFIPFLKDCQTLDDYLEECEEGDAIYTTYQLFDDLKSAHQQQIIYGDRWSKNILITKAGIIHIDFDLEISGPPAREFEVAQAAYYTLCGGREKVVSTLGRILAQNSNWFDFDKVSQFLWGHARHFRKSTRYGNAEANTDMLIAITRRYKELLKL